MGNLARWAWALVVPFIVIAVPIALIKIGTPELFWFLIMFSVGVGALPLATAEWTPTNRAVAVIVYAPIMGFLVFITAILTACYAHGCH